jgi:hypothetical protein
MLVKRICFMARSLTGSNLTWIWRNVMTRKTPVGRNGRKAAVAEEESAVFSRAEQIMLRPDGYYWLAPDGRQQFGPFESRELLLDEMGATDELTPEPGETLQEAEDEIGIADWIDPETGEPAQGQSPPRLDGE